jgi:putative membrane protein
MLELILLILLGVLAGTITGLTPGIHTNLVAAFILTLTPFLTDFPILNVVVFLVAMAMTHTFTDFIPSIYLGAPDEDTSVAVLPGHQFLLQGKAHQAVQYTTLGSAIAVVLLLVIIPISFLFLAKIYPFVSRMMAWILIWVSFFLIYQEKDKKLISLIFFILAGFLGISAMNMNISQPLLPLLSGLFGSSTLIYSISTQTKIPEQIKEKFKLKKEDIIKPSIITSLVSPICSFLPGLGSSQAAIIGLSFSKETTDEQFLVLTGSINTLVMAFSFYTLYLISKTRSGIASAISQLTTLTSTDLTWISIAIIISSFLASFITLKISRLISKNSERINYLKTSKVILLFLSSVTIAITGFVGFFIFITSTFLGLTCIHYNVKRSFLMGCLVVPCILFYLPFF